MEKSPNPYSFKSLLEQELQRRTIKNPQYSLRKFAKDINVSAGFLSQIIKGHRSLSVEKGMDISKALGWDDDKQNLFVKLILLNNSRSVEVKSNLTREIHKNFYQEDDKIQLELEKFELISKWYHLALLELTKVKGFRSEVNWIANRLGITEDQALDALQRLEQLDLLTYEQGQFKCSQNNRIKDVPSKAIQKYHTQNIEMAKEAITSQPFEKRDFSGLTIAIDPEKIDQVKQVIRDFRNELSNLLHEGNKENVYQLNIQFFKLDKETTNENL